MHDTKSRKTSIARLVILGTALAILLILSAYVIYQHEPSAVLKHYLESRISPALFLFLMLFLPILGVPISIFLVMIGMKFGIVEGTLLSALVMLLHMVFTYYLVHSFLRAWITSLLRYCNIPIPPETKKPPSHRHAIIFMLIPGLPYVAKNNLLALAGLSFVPYLLINWTTQFALSVPLILLGGAVTETNLSVLAVALTLVLGSYILQRYIRQKYREARTRPEKKSRD